jgi:YidC/Oxa1 family membrane protein insertase
MLLLPLFFVIFIISFPAGLILYWITTNTWTMGQQWVIRRRIGPVVPVTAAGPSPPSGARDEGGDGRRPTPAPNGDAGGGLGGLLRGKTKSETKEPAAVGSGTRPRREAPPPRPPRKKKKRSGRRR